MTKICTNIKQSKKLVELGLDVNTADMCWSTANPGLEVLLAFPFTDADNTYGDKIPAWSLSALLELLPIVNESTYTMRGTLDGGAIISHEELTCVVSQEDNPLDAVFEMVCWLLESRKL